METLAKIRNRISELQKIATSINFEIAELETAERVVARLENPQDKNEARVGPTLSQPDMVVATLKTLKEPWVDNWAVLQTTIHAIHNVEIPKSSLQPYLSNLKNKGIIVRDGARIALRDRVAKGAGPQSDESYDPDTAIPENDDSEMVPTRTRTRPTPPPWATRN